MPLALYLKRGIMLGHWSAARANDTRVGTDVWTKTPQCEDSQPRFLALFACLPLLMAHRSKPIENEFEHFSVRDDAGTIGLFCSFLPHSDQGVGEGRGTFVWHATHAKIGRMTPPA